MSSLLSVTINASLVCVLRRIVAVVAPPFSEISDSAMVSVRTATSSSVMSTMFVPSTCAGAMAVTLTVCVPSTIGSSIPSISNAADVDCPAGIVTETGTVASPASLLANVTVRAAEVSVLRLTVAVVEPPFSEIAPDRIASVSAATSSSIVIHHIHRVHTVHMSRRHGRDRHCLGAVRDAIVDAIDSKHS